MVRAALSPSTASSSPRYQRTAPSGWHACSIWVRSLLAALSPDEPNTTGPGTLAPAVHPLGPPAQSLAVSTRKVLGAVRTARAALAGTGAPLTVSLPLSCSTMVSRPPGWAAVGPNRVSSTVMGEPPPATADRFPTVVLL